MKIDSTILILIFGSITMIIISVLSIFFGAANVSPQVVVNAIFNFDPSNSTHQIIREIRLPRTIASVFVGAALSVAGAVMQGITRNPIADSGLLGINAGASFALALSFAFFPSMPYSIVIIVAFMGAGISTLVVYAVTSYNRGQLSPVRLVLAGTSVSIFFSSLSQAISIHYNIGQNLLFWTSGSLAGTNFVQIGIMIPWVLIALCVAIVLSRYISILSLGEDVAKGLGLKITLIKILCLIVVLVLSGGSVIVAGTISFVGLITPHIARYIVGVDYRKVIPCSIVLGSLFMVVADIIARVINVPNETPVGLIFSLIGVPFFLFILRKGKGGLNG